jgi:putative RNA 2'-phosphotransferase
MQNQLKHISKLLSLVLRHEPEHIGLTLDEQGWAKVPELITKVNQKGLHLDFATLQIVVDTNDKKRFAFNEDKSLIRANQGHSIEVDLKLTQQIPPSILFHGTVEKNVLQIKQHGLQKMNRHHVHLTANEETAFKVGQRHGKPVILTIQAMVMHEQQYIFYVSGNAVWLTDHVPIDFISW